MSRPRIVECDGCGERQELDDYGVPPGWITVKAQNRNEERADAEGEFCFKCAHEVDVAALAARGRLWNPPKAPKKTRPKQAELIEEGR